MNLEEIVKKLHQLNFGRGGLIEFVSGEEDYHFGCLESGRHVNYNVHTCNLCNEFIPEGVEGGCEYTSISHGAHTLDFLRAHGLDSEAIKGWSKRPVMFVMENPALPDTGYEKTQGKVINKQWYWINEQFTKANDDFYFPNYFTQKGYGGMIYSAIRTFKIGNAYLTNLVKCGMKSGNHYLTTDDYHEKTIKECIEKRLHRELEVLCGDDKNQTAIIFAFGERTYYKLKEYFSEKNIYLLPHPANRLANDYRKYVLFGKILQGLLQNDFYTGVQEKPDFEQILRADCNNAEEEKSPESLYKSALENSCNKGEILEKRKSYKEGIFGYEFTFEKVTEENTQQISDEILSLIVRYQGKDGVPEPYNVSWVEYNFHGESLRLYAGKGNTSNVCILENPKHFKIYGLMTRFLNRIGKKTPILQEY